MADQITKILIRKGTNEQKNAVILNEAELGYTTDNKRVYIGDGSTSGGILVGNNYQGVKNLTTEINQLSTAQLGDYVFDSTDSTFYVLSGANATNIGSYSKVVTSSFNLLEAGTGIIFNGADAFITPTSSGFTINIKIDPSRRNLITNSSKGLLGNYEILYPVGSVIFNENNINPSSSGGACENAGQTWVSIGTLTTSTSTVVYGWLRAG